MIDRTTGVRVGDSGIDGHGVFAMLRQLGAAPPKDLDLIVFYRER